LALPLALPLGEALHVAAIAIVENLLLIVFPSSVQKLMILAPADDVKPANQRFYQERI
jgi:hypothetical protein